MVAGKKQAWFFTVYNLCHPYHLSSACSHATFSSSCHTSNASSVCIMDYWATVNTSHANNCSTHHLGLSTLPSKKQKKKSCSLPSNAGCAADASGKGQIWSVGFAWFSGDRHGLSKLLPHTQEMLWNFMPHKASIPTHRSDRRQEGEMSCTVLAPTGPVPESQPLLHSF